MRTMRCIFCLLLGPILLAACGEPAEVEEIAAPITTTISVSEDPEETEALGCVNDANITYLCGPANAEDILQIGESEWLLASGMNGELSGNGINGSLHLINHIDKTYEVLFPSENPVIEQDMEMFANCPGPIDTSNISIHGLTMQTLDTGPDHYRVYITSHGAREAIEVFDVDAFLKPTVKWVGCIPVPATSWSNSITILADGGFYATQFMDLVSDSIENVVAEEITGHVFEWHPGGEVTVVPNTHLSGANGIVISDDERWLYVAAFGTREIVRFDTSVVPMSKETVALRIAPDNLRWSAEGTLYTAGNFAVEECANTDCGAGWGVYEIDPDSLEAELISSIDASAALGDASSALVVGDEIWVGTFDGDRLGILPKP
jgi:hypothetical protein